MAASEQKTSRSSATAVYGMRTEPHPKINLQVTFEFHLKPKLKCFRIAFSSEIPLEGAWISSDVPLQFIPSESANYEMTLTTSDTETKLGNRFSCTLRLKPNTKSADFSFRPVEGFGGTLEIFVSAANETGRCAQRKAFPLAPLSSYQKIDAVDEKRPFNTLQINGQFSVLKMKSWLQLCFQELSFSSTKTENSEWVFAFESIITGSQLQCQLREQEILFRCENPSSLAILMQVLARQATQERNKLDLRPTILPETMITTLEKVDSMLAPVIGRNKVKTINEAVAEISAAESGSSMLHPIFQSPGWRKMHGRDEDDGRTAGLDAAFLQALVIDLFKDYAKLRGKSVTSKMPELIASLLSNYDLRALQELAVQI